MAKHSSYSFVEDITATINGVPLTDFAAEGLTISYVNDRNTPVVGANGNVIMAKNEDKLATMTINLAYNSLSNDYLNGLALSEVYLTGFVKDAKTGSTHTLIQGKISGEPEITFGQEPGSLVWTITFSEWQPIRLGTGVARALLR